MKKEVERLSGELNAAMALADAPGPPPDTREIIPSASKTDIYLECGWPWYRRLPRESVGLPARFGSAFHELLARMIPARTSKITISGGMIRKKWGQDVDPLLVYERAAGAFAELDKWLAGENPWETDFWSRPRRVEMSIAYDPVFDTARECAPPDEATHVYPDLQRGELPGTVDLVCLPKKKGQGMLVLDHKSGWMVDAPSKSGQLRSLALSLSRLFGVTNTVGIAFLHAPSTGITTIYPETVTLDELEEHRQRLIVAGRRVGDGSLRPGDWCSYCPAFIDCPTQRSSLVELKRGPIRLPMTAERVGYIHQALAEYRLLEEALKDEMRDWVERNGPGIRPDGKLVGLFPKKFSNLSQASIKRALGEVKGIKLIEQLRKQGCIEEGERMEMRAGKAE